MAEPGLVKDAMEIGAHDPAPGVHSAVGVGLLPVETVFEPEKATHQVRGEVVAHRGFWGRLRGLAVEGYEIHMGHTEGEAPPALQVRRLGQSQSHPDGAVDPRGRVMGTYLHGIFDQAGFRHALISELRRRKGLPPQPLSDIPTAEENYQRLAAAVRESLDMELLYRVCGLSAAPSEGLRTPSESRTKG